MLNERSAAITQGVERSAARAMFKAIELRTMKTWENH